MRNAKLILSIAAWCLYDWATSSFSTIVMTFVFAIYFTTNIASNKIMGTFLWANATALSGIAIAVLSPLCGAIADYGGHHKRWLFSFTMLCVVSSALLWFAYPSEKFIFYTLACVVLGNIGLEVGYVFYNAYLPQLAPKPYLGRVSGWGWGSGYIGGILALSISLIVFLHGKPTWLNHQTFAQVRICGPFVAVWIFIFSIPLFVIMADIASNGYPLKRAISAGTKELIATLKALPQEKNIFLFLIAHMIYADGLNTLFAFGGIFAAGTYGFSLDEALLFGITMNITAGLGAIVLGWMDDYLGSKLTVLVSLVFLAVLGTPLLLLENKYLFWGFALALGLFVGPVQSASRSLMARLISARRSSTEMFGLYALSGKITAFIGPWLLGMITLTFGSQRVGMAIIIVFFVIGGLLLIPVKVKQEVSYDLL